jgi:signal transduction histidine kinase/CheY-like chemotaxis protein
MDQLPVVSLLLRLTGCAWLLYGLSRTPNLRILGLLVLVATFALIQGLTMVDELSSAGDGSAPEVWVEWESVLLSAILLAWSVWTQRSAAELSISRQRREAERARHESAFEAKQQELRARARQQESVANLGRRVLTTTELRGVFDEAVHTVARALDVSHCALYEYLPTTRSLMLRAASGTLNTYLGSRIEATRDHYVGRVLLQGQPMIVEDFDDMRGEGRPKLLPYGTAKSGAAVRVPGVDAPFGVIAAHTSEPARFGPEDLYFLACVGNLLAAAVERDRTMAELDKSRHHKLQAEKLDALGKVVGGIAHDCNNVLHAILNYTQFAVRDIETGDTERVAHHLERVRVSADRVSQLMKQLLTFRPGSFGQRRSVSVAQIVDEVVHDMGSGLASSIKIQTHVADRSACVKADGIELHRVLFNLCTNAAQAMQRSGGQLGIGVDAVELEPEAVPSGLDLPPGHYVRIWVSDTGHGILHGIRDRIFEPFFSASPDGDAPRSGYGLGLWVVREVVKNHDGAIEFESKLGAGSTFQVYLPRELGEPRDAARPPMPARASLRGHETVLFVDDELKAFDFTDKELEKRGYHVMALTDSTRALELFRADPDRFDVAILDQCMPGLAGDELAREMLRVRPELPIIVYTGYAEALTEDRAYEIGIRRYLLKPIPMDALLEAIRAVLDESSRTL